MNSARASISPTHPLFHPRQPISEYRNNNGTDDALKVIEFDEAGNEHLNTSTLDEFEHNLTVYVDYGLALFTLCNAG